jgi:hypothetical protein
MSITSSLDGWTDGRVDLGLLEVRNALMKQARRSGVIFGYSGQCSRFVLYGS